MCGKIPSMGVEATELVSSRADDVAHRAVELVLEAAPGYTAALDAGGRKLWEEEMRLHVRALIGSVAAADPHIFADYARWAEGLRSLGIAAEHLAALFGATSQAIDELVPSAGSLVQPHLEAGERALTH
jgi:hypothetical protein